MDLFQYDNKDYLITVCYRSNFWEIDKLSDTKSKTVIGKLKAHCARYGIPEEIVSDNGPQYISDEFAVFTRGWGIRHTTTSPYLSNSNGKAESAVKTAKKMLKKTCGEDQYLALLNYRNTPTQGTDSSPVQRFLGRRTRTIFPTASSLLKPRDPDTMGQSDTTQLIENQKRQAKYYNRTAHSLHDLKVGDMVRVKPAAVGDKTWKKARVLKKLGHRSYEVQLTATGAVYRRNRKHLRQMHTKAATVADEGRCSPTRRCSETVPHGDCRPTDVRVQQADQTTQAPSTRARSKRTARVPERFKDYVRY